MLAFDIEFGELYTLDGLNKLHKIFLNYVRDTSPGLYAQLSLAYMKELPPLEADQLYVDLAPHVEDFISYLFDIAEHVQINQQRHKFFSIVPKVKREFVQRYALREAFDPLINKPDLDLPANHADFDHAFAQAVFPYMHDMHTHKKYLQPYVHFTHWAVHTKEGQKQHQDSILFQQPYKQTAQAHCIAALKQDKQHRYVMPAENLIHRKGFDLTDKGHNLKKAYAIAQYCIHCHHQQRDYCSKGHPKETQNKGCPLGQKISQMAEVKSQGYDIGALAIVCVDNPLVAATGHRICNDCRASCIYQKQESVDVPGLESQIYNNVLQLPYGFEIYSLLTRWNPLNFTQPLPHAPIDKNVLVVGQGPAGFALAYYLMRSGVQVLAIDGCKIEPIDKRFKATDLPIINIHDTLKPLSERMVSGFGGVAEYGITPRWNKNNLFIIRLLLERNPLYTLKGGILYGDMLRPENAFSHGIDHIALCTGAGAPKFTQTPNSLARGMYTASDFLMSLQLTGNFKQNSLGCLTIQMPIVVIGGGLTAIDAATEAQTFYIKHLETLAQRIEALKAKNVWDNFLQNLNTSEKIQLQRWQDHIDQLVCAKIHAQQAGHTFNPIDLLHQWGGCTILYRKAIEQAPSLTLNPQEVYHAFQEGIFLLDEVTVTSYNLDDHGAIQSIGIKRLGYESTLPARTVILAVGTNPGDVMKHTLN